MTLRSISPPCGNVGYYVNIPIFAMIIFDHWHTVGKMTHLSKGSDSIATGGNGTKSYLFELYKGNDLLDYRTYELIYGATKTFSYSPTEAGTYSVKGFVKDSTDTVSMMSDDVTLIVPKSNIAHPDL